MRLLLKGELLALLVLAMTLALPTPAHGDSQRMQDDTSATICMVDGAFSLTAAEGLRRVGSWTASGSARDACPSDTICVELARIGIWAVAAIPDCRAAVPGTAGSQQVAG